MRTINCVYCPGLRLTILHWQDSDWVPAPQLASTWLDWSPVTLQKELSKAGRLAGFRDKIKCSDKNVLRKLVCHAPLGDGCGSVAALRCVNLIRLQSLPDLLQTLGQDRARIDEFQCAYAAWQVHLLSLVACVNQLMWMPLHPDGPATSAAASAALCVRSIALVHTILGLAAPWRHLACLLLQLQ